MPPGGIFFNSWGGSWDINYNRTLGGGWDAHLYIPVESGQ
jgi:hypothetical protein